jgi:hypothetical protein
LTPTASTPSNAAAAAAAAVTTALPARTAPGNQHQFKVHNYMLPTFCICCDKLLVGLFKQGLQCDSCHMNCHEKCALLVPHNCQAAANTHLPPFPNTSYQVSDIPDHLQHPPRTEVVMASTTCFIC